jgi:hypothetical protein
LRVRLPPLRLQHASAGHWRAQVAVTHPHCCAGSTPARRTDTARSSIGSGPRFLTPARGVRFPYGLLTLTGWWNRQTHSAQNAGPRKGHGSSTLPLVTFCCRRAGARPTLIRSACPARYRGLLLPDGPVPGGGSWPQQVRCDSWVRHCRPSTQTRKSGHLEGVVTLWVRLPPRLLGALV